MNITETLYLHIRYGIGGTFGTNLTHNLVLASHRMWDHLLTFGVTRISEPCQSGDDPRESRGVREVRRNNVSVYLEEMVSFANIPMASAASW